MAKGASAVQQTFEEDNMMDIETMVAREAIRLVVSIYNSAVDRGDYADLEQVFARDGEMIISDEKRLGGRDDIIAKLSAGARSRGAYEAGNYQRHILGNSIINVTEADRAKSVHYIVVMTEKGLDHSGVYIDDFIVEDGNWRIATRRANMEWAREDSRFFTYPGTTFISPVSALDVFQI
ncbi:SnoaL-like domain-containing protein [Sphingopyxis sp. YR583]|nr:SnoaL-like domain-containing protein [Sphingopyxis sp. YR583]